MSSPSSLPTSFQSFSVPSSPANVRSAKGNPVTPQRVPRQHRHSQSFYGSIARSPLTSSPYTPLSVASDTSSTLITPESIHLGAKRRLGLAYGSPEVVRSVSMHVQGKDNSLADIAENWRSRANENGIKVSQESSQFLDDDGSEINDSSFINNEDILPSAFFSAHRRTSSEAISTRLRTGFPSADALSNTPSLQPQATSSPVRSRRTLGSLNQSMNTNLMSTPPPNRTLASQLKLKGSFTDPAQPRRREAFGSIHSPSQNVNTPAIANRSMNYLYNRSVSLNPQDTSSLDLFDIDENDFEFEPDYPEQSVNYTQQPSNANDSFTLNLQRQQRLASLNIGNANIMNTNYGYPPVRFAPTLQQTPSFSNFADPFLSAGMPQPQHQSQPLTNMSESLENQFHSQRFREDMHYGYGTRLPIAQPTPQLGMLSQGYPKPVYVPIPAFPSPVLPPPSPAILSAPAESVSGDADVEDASSTCGALSNSSSAPSPDDCSVCLAPSPSTLAVLKPCEHPLCSGCLTSALNIVGEKDMECAVCKTPVADFKLVVGKKNGTASPVPEKNEEGGEKNDNNMKIEDEKDRKKVALDGAFSLAAGSPISCNGTFEIGNESVGELESPFEFGLDFQVGEMRASTPKLEQQAAASPFGKKGSQVKSLIQGKGKPAQKAGGITKRGDKKNDDNVVLRIDNVPWDITPSQIIRWLQQPVVRVHVLLDPKGKTLSHAYIEVADAAIAGAVLRGEVAGPGKKERRSVLGKGKRARGVTVTRSCQEELMKDLFPHWKGSFDGSRPSLAGMTGDRIIKSLEGGLLTEGELAGLLYLIKEPDSHFLKVPSLPFHSLASILSKFPADVDSRVFWSTGVRDILFDATYAAMQVLIARVEKAKQNLNEEEYTSNLVNELAHTAVHCRAFTTQQVRKFAELLRACSVTLPEGTEELCSSRNSAPRTPSGGFQHGNFSVHPGPVEPFGDLAREFGVEAQLVHALAQRLAGAGLC
ncbi:hypothetical protein BDQ17DRAFT_1355829 [Cyathus striatus]|nr:hypothetical protein BDQ17DRAFT_1355829 [Cyathus striatus]